MALGVDRGSGEGHFPRVWMKPLLLIPLLLASFRSPAVALDIWELAPIHYSDAEATDPIAKLSEDLAAGKVEIEGDTDVEKLRYVLRLLGIPVESQMLVFSKTSQQNALIRPENPRSLFYNEHSYVGYVPGGDIEIITHDPVLGMVFYLVDLGQKDRARMISRDANVCLACHGTQRTEGVPGVLVRSVHPDESGHLLLALGAEHIDSRTPIPHRWGGYYVTGRSTLPHLGNRIYQETDTREETRPTPEYRTLADIIDVSKYPRDTSDIISLMVLEHQCRVHNLLVAASMNYRRTYWFKKSLDPQSDPDQGKAGELADELAEEVVEALLFKGEAPMGDGGVDGDTAFQDAFAKRVPKTKSGDSLAEFQLADRLFKNRCSYMIYSPAFTVLPPRVKSAVLKRLSGILEDETKFPEMKTPERRRIMEILRETVPGYGA